MPFQEPTSDANIITIHPTTLLTISIATSSITTTCNPARSQNFQKYPAKQHCQKVSTLLRLAGHERSTAALIYLPGARDANHENSDMPIKLRQRRYFSYLSGVTNDLWNCSLIYNLEKDHLVLYIPSLNPNTVLWSGLPRSKEGAMKLYDVDDVRFLEDCAVDVLRWIQETTSKESGTRKDEPQEKPVIYCLNEEQRPDFLGRVSDLWKKEKQTKKDRSTGGDSFYKLDTTLLKRCIDECRTTKDAFEISLMKKAISITRKAHIAVKNSLSRSKNEAELEGRFLGKCVSRQAKDQAYDPIVCSGRNCATLHYTKNNSSLYEGGGGRGGEGGAKKQLVLIDAGCEWKCYASDITRTWPINGEFSVEAANIYRIVDRMQTEAIAKSVAGVLWSETHFLAHRILVEEFLKIGIFKGGSVDEIFKIRTSNAFFPHGLGHMIGLEVHDVEGIQDHLIESLPLAECLLYPIDEQAAARCPKDVSVSMSLIRRVLRPGMVITVEPGIYFNEFIINSFLKSEVHSKYIDKKELDRYWDVGGVRIEDMILINEVGEGNEVLSQCIPKASV